MHQLQSQAMTRAAKDGAGLGASERLANRARMKLILHAKTGELHLREVGHRGDVPVLKPELLRGRGDLLQCFPVDGDIDILGGPSASWPAPGNLQENGQSTHDAILDPPNRVRHESA